MECTFNEKLEILIDTKKAFCATDYALSYYHRNYLVYYCTCIYQKYSLLNQKIYSSSSSSDSKPASSSS